MAKLAGMGAVTVPAVFILLFVRAVPARSADGPKPASLPVTASLLPLGGDGWLLAADPGKVGRQRQWWTQPTPEARSIRVPSVIQEVYPDYHGVAWYWRDFAAPANPHPEGRYLLRFWNVDYQADVWVNGRYVGGHECADGRFVLDATDAVKPATANRLAVRVLNPSEQPIDGLVLKQTPHRNKTCAFTYGCDYNHGGIEGPVELIVSPAVRVEDLFVRPDWKTGAIDIQTNLRNASANPSLSLSRDGAGPDRGFPLDGRTIDALRIPRFPPGRRLLPLERPATLAPLLPYGKLRADRHSRSARPRTPAQGPCQLQSHGLQRGEGRARAGLA
jgi:hypothetical protein